MNGMQERHEKFETVRREIQEEQELNSLVISWDKARQVRGCY
jgi:hypothetical protein